MGIGPSISTSVAGKAAGGFAAIVQSEHIHEDDPAVQPLQVMLSRPHINTFANVSPSPFSPSHRSRAFISERFALAPCFSI